MAEVSRRQFLAGAAGVAAAQLAAGTPLHPASISLARGVSQAPGGEPTRVRLSDGWEFYQGPLAGPWQVWHSEELAAFAPVTMPHSFNAYDGCDPDVPYYRGQGWYRTRLKLANPFQGGRTLLHFLGSGQVKSVFVGEELVVTHEGGYDEWVADITQHAKKWLAYANETDRTGGVPLSVVCDNSRSNERIPSDFSDFSLYGGLYRHVELVYVPMFSIGRMQIDVIDAGAESADVVVSVFLEHKGGCTCGLFGAEVEIKTADGVIIEAKSHHEWDPNGFILTTAKATISSPRRWSHLTPTLYTCTATVKFPATDELHSLTERFGIRHYEFEEHGPFKLNGERLMLRGTHRHEDHAGYANAMPDELIREEMKLMKAMGVNFIRLAHYQQTRLVLELCDELGILVWEELPWCRAGVGDEHWKAMSRDKLTAMIAQHRNHPSVILWGLGNEDDWPTEYPGIDEAAIRAWMTELRELAHRLDPSRLTSFRRCDFARDIPDVYSPSIWAGWYSGLYREYEASLEKERGRVKRMLHMEWGADSLAGRHSEMADEAVAGVSAGHGTDERGLDYKPSGGAPRVSRDGDWSETYACDLFDWHLKTQESLPWLTGTAQWIFKDFTTPLRVENPIPRINMKGVVTRDGQPKESYYVFQSYWAEEPMVHIYGHTWPVRWGAAGEMKVVKVYSNCDEVELFHGDTPLGTRKRNAQDFPGAGLRWTLPFAAGGNTLRAVGKKKGRTVTDRLAFEYETRRWGTPASLMLEWTPAGSIAAGQRRFLVSVRLQDAAGVPCLDSRARVRFSLAGEGKLVDNQGTPWGSREVELANGYARITVLLTGWSVQVGVATKAVPPAYVQIGPINPEASHPE